MDIFEETSQKLSIILDEDTANNYLVSIFNDCFNNFSKLNLNINRNNIKNIKFVWRQSPIGLCTTVGQKQYELTFAIIFAKKKNKECLDLLKKVIYHELCHCVQLNACFDANLIVYNIIKKKVEATQGKDDEVYKVLKANSGHTKFWNTIANTVANKLKINIDSFLTDVDYKKLYEGDFMEKEELGTFADYKISGLDSKAIEDIINGVKEPPKDLTIFPDKTINEDIDEVLLERYKVFKK